MTQPTPLTDLRALIRNRARADTSALFLQEAARDEVEDRVAMVNKSFSSAGIVAAFPDLWQGRLANARVVGESDILPFSQGEHDLLIHSLGLHWANDPVGQLIQCRRALRPDGLFLAVALGGQTLHELRTCLAEAEIAETGGLSPRVAPMAEVRDLGALLQRAGLALPVADTVPLRAEYRSMWHLMHDLRAIGEANALTARSRSSTRAGILKRAAGIYETAFPGADGGIMASFELIVLTGWAPDDSQQKPLRPGSAQARLADALRTDETSLPD
ncbi:SAM-dependent methyltransferase [Tateyamaria omphalii]|uniref:methyltransferase domain-containing protein n=1 Tax=Tateyamaria omphalii TaxID=299262 RepID=UPI0016770F25|nr:methyltransferase domain-containing protein [Tateyamaria omphalii]GGX40057.1 SAM-dependent methyltransferase [Tateyamaria omphalii]